MKENTAKNFVIQLGALISLYISLTALIVLVFGIINLKFPDELDYYATAESVREAIRVCIALLVVFFPTFIALTRMRNQIRRKEEDGLYTGLTKWLIFLSLLAGGGIILGDLVAILVYFLNGEITSRFIFKALALLVVVSIAFKYYLLDVRGHFKNLEKQSITFGAAATLLVLTALVTGYVNIETPTEAREMKLDNQQVHDLQNIQSYIEEYYRINETLPMTLEEAYDGFSVPKAPENRVAYRYLVTDDTSYELCATFLAATQENGSRSYAYPAMEKNYNWTHGAGEKCFQRAVVDNLK